jgi:hypothetical protein
MSIPVAFNTINEQAGILESFEFDTAAEDMHILYYIARNQLYSDELSALLREYGVNATDIHIATGQGERPIRVTLPTQLEPLLKIRDFGTGLDSEGIKEYAMFGRSSKRGDPRQTGQLGIGCKCGFTYGDSFLVNSYQDGQVTTWNAYIDPSNKGKIDCLAVSPTSEENGIEVIIPIRPNDVDKCQKKAAQLFCFFKVTPDMVNLTDDHRQYFNALKSAAPLFQGEGWRYMGAGPSCVVMGNVPYPINADNFTELELRDETKALLTGGLILDVQMDSLDFAASREQLKYTPKTKTNLAARLSDVATELLRLATASFDGCATLWEAKQLHQDMFTYHGKLYHLRHLFAKFKFKGFSVGNDAFSCRSNDGSDTDVVCHKYLKPRSGSDTKVRKETTYDIKAHKNSLVVINDASISNGIMNRIVPLIERPAQQKMLGMPVEIPDVYLLSFRDSAAQQAWVTETGFDGPTILLSSLPKEPLNLYYPLASCAGVKNAKHTSQEFTYDGDGKSRYGTARSGYWEVADVDLANDEGVYVELKSFNCRLTKSFEWSHPIELRRLLEKFVSAGIEVPDTIYGLKEKSVIQARNNTKLVPLSQWCADAMRAYLKAKPAILQECINYAYVQKQMQPLHSGLQDMLNTLSRWPTPLPTDHALIKLQARVQAVSKFSAYRVTTIQELAATYGVELKGQVSDDISDTYHALAAKYPLLFQIARRLRLYDFQAQEVQSGLQDYVTMVDMFTP